MNKIHINEKTEIPDNVNFFFYTNIWLHLYGPNFNYKDPRVEKYSKLLKMISEQPKCKIYIDYLVMAEFSNRYVRDIFNEHHKIEYQTFKSFRLSQPYRDIITNLADEFYHITEDTEKIYCDLSDIMIDDVLNEVSHGKVDFNDMIIVNICKRLNLALVTDDSDFFEQDMTIYSANNRITQQR